VLGEAAMPAISLHLRHTPAGATGRTDMVAETSHLADCATAIVADPSDELSAQERYVASHGLTDRAEQPRRAANRPRD
jgi:hypothetical protein